MPSRDQLTRQLMGDPFGSVSERSRFALAGDPGFGTTALKLIGKLGKNLLGHRSQDLAMMHTPRQALGFPTLPSVTARGRLVPRGSVTASGRLLPPGPGGYLLPSGGRLRHHKRMRVTNVKALRRAMRRVQGFAKLAAHTIRFTKRVHMRKARRGRR
jgi:hypothetical protein